MKNRSIVYFLLGLYTAIVSWYYYHSIVWLIINWVFWPISLLFFLLTGKLAHEQWINIPKHFFN